MVIWVRWYLEMYLKQRYTTIEANRGLIMYGILNNGKGSKAEIAYNGKKTTIDTKAGKMYAIFNLLN
jgi:hypothetical protein